MRFRIFIAAVDYKKIFLQRELPDLWYMVQTIDSFKNLMEIAIYG